MSINNNDYNIPNVTISDTFESWRVKTNDEIIAKLNQLELYTVDIASATGGGITTDVATAGQQLSIISTAGTTYTFTGHGSTTVTSTGQFSVATGEVEMMTALLSCFNAADSHVKGIFTATLDGAVLTIKQVEPGPDGNTVVTENMDNTTKTDFTGG